MDELGPDEQRWLDVLRAADEPTATDRARVRASVIATIAGAGAVTVATGVAKSGAVVKAAGTASVVTASWKIGVAVVAIALAGGAAVVLGRAPGMAATGGTSAARTATSQEPTASDTAPPAPFPSAAAPSVSSSGDPAAAAGVPETAGVPEAVAVPAPTAIAAAAPSGAPRVVAPRASHAHADDVEAELSLLTQAQRALERGDAKSALAALGRHAREHPRGALAVEREGLRAVASCEAKLGDGRALAERFVARNPTSPLVARVRGACLSP